MIERTLFFDLETDLKGGRISKAGLYIESLGGGAAWPWAAKQELGLLRERLDEALFAAAAISGHNIWRHDLPVLALYFPQLARLNSLPVADTLELSPLCFPKNPYHALEKDYKPTGREENDPLGDAVLARDLLRREIEVLKGLREKEPALHRALHGLCAAGEGRMERGCALVFGGEAPSEEATLAASRKRAGLRGCATAAAKLKLPAGREERMALAFVLSWLTVAGDRQSVLPGWVWRNFPRAREFAAALRDTPCTDPSCAWCIEQFDARTLLRKWFPGFADFRVDEDGRSLQREIVETALAGKSLLAILPTGGGKSLCYQLPALARMERRGMLTIVISPLQSLMKDQVDQMARRAPEAAGCVAALNGLLTPLERRDVLHRVALGDVSLLYVAPEQLRNRSFGQAIRQREIGAWIFDEAHCLSKWGHDFRTDYLYAERFIRELGAPVPPAMYVTATAKSAVVQEIREFHEAMTGSRELTLFEAPVERIELRFEVVQVPPGERMEKIAEILSARCSTHGRGGAIVFRSTREKARKTAEFLKAKEWKAAPFHAGLPPSEKKDVQDRFISGDLQVIAATNAFGMGVDKEDVRVVIHGDMPGSLENYLQEAGRAGRDRQRADCVLLFDASDADWQFGINGMNCLGRRDITEILRALRRYKRKAGEPIVLTVGELMRTIRLREIGGEGESQPEAFGEDDSDLNKDKDNCGLNATRDERGLNTKVKTAISWLERSNYLKRDDNVTGVFQAKPIAKTRREAELKAEEAGQPPERQKLWGDIVHEFLRARADEGINADRLITLPSFEEAWQRKKDRGRRRTSFLFDELRAMTQAGLLKRCTAMTAYVRYKVADHSRLRFDRLRRAEEQMLTLLAEQGANTGESLALDTAALNQRLKDEGAKDTELEAVERIARALAGLEANGARMLDIRPGRDTRHRVTLRVEMTAIQEAAAFRREVAETVLETILNQVPASEPPSADVLAEFTMEHLCEAVESNLLLRAKKPDVAAVERALLWMHDLEIIRLQKGLALFRSAMTIKVAAAEPLRPYTDNEYKPLHEFYEEKTFQVHVMLEYAARGLQNIQATLGLVFDYFRLDKKAFIERYFPGRKKELEQAVTAEAHREIVENLDEDQRSIVEAKEEKNLLVLAGPGSGKTRTVVHRIALLLKISHVPAHSILAICFNRDAAVLIRRRLLKLAGDPARGVTVMTYHGLAMRLTGASFAALAGRAGAGEADFDRPIRDAIRLLRGERGAQDAGADADETRDRLLAGFRHILVDEYQDVNEIEYELISALAGRTRKDKDAKLNLLAVGDDDQSIYGFNEADVRFIRQFEKDYEADRYGLTSNYRSSRNIVEAAARVISENRHRMKAGISLHVDLRRTNDPPGDPVRLIAANGLSEQAVALFRQVKEWNAAGAEWQDMAVLGVKHEDVNAFRSIAEGDGVPVNARLVQPDGKQGGSLPPLWRMRECMMTLDELKKRTGQAVNREAMHAVLSGVRDGCGENVWTGLLDGIAEDCAESEPLAEDWIEHFHEALAVCRRDGRVGRNGIWLSTIHAAKGTEHKRVAVAGRWDRPERKNEEEARRLLYVAMTRAKKSLAVVDRADARSRLLLPLRTQAGIEKIAAPDLKKSVQLKTYTLLGPKEFDLSFGGRNPQRVRTISEALKKLRAGDRLEWTAERDNVMIKSDGCAVAKLSKQGVELFRAYKDRVEEIRVLGVYAWRKEDSDPEWRDRCAADRWGVPLCEAVLRT